MKQTISPRQAAIALLGLLLVRTTVAAPLGLGLVLSTAAPWAIVVAGLLACAFVWPVIAATAGRGLSALALEAGGRPAAIATALLVGGGFITGGAMELRQIAEVTVTALYPHTPQTFATVTLLGCAALGAAISPPGLIWVTAAMTWSLAIFVTLVAVGNIGWGDWQHILPLSGHGLLPAVAELLPLTSNFGRALLPAIIGSYLPGQSRQVAKAAVFAVTAAAILWSMVVTVYLMVLPPPGGLSVPFPFFELTRLVQGGRFLERIDALWVLSLAFGSAASLALMLQAAALLLRDAFRLPVHQGAILPLALALLSISLFPGSQADAMDVEFWAIGRWSFLITLVLPLLLTGVAALRRRGTRGQA